MLKDITKIVALVCVLGVPADPAFAQRGGGGPRGGGSGGRGGGGTANTGGAGMCSRSSGAATAANGNQGNTALTNFFANSANSATNANTQRQRMQRFQNNGASVNASNGNRPTATQFVQAALRFDADSDGELSSAELTQVATAVITELQTRQQTQRGSMAVAGNLPGRARPPGGGLPTNATLPEMTTAFVTKALTFDRDDSGTLSATETRALATAFIRSLG